MRQATVTRKTKETDITIALGLQAGEREIDTGIGFFDHMLSSFALHGGFALTVRAAGDLQVDGHHTIEDVGIVLGQAFAQALGDKAGIRRFGSMLLPMDEALVQCALDISGRPYLRYTNDIPLKDVGDFDCQMVEEFLRAFAMNAGITLHVRVLDGVNSHHIIEGIFKALARALKEAAALEGDGGVPSAKGVL